MAKILILIGGPLCSAPRSQKEAETLTHAGHEVIVAGFWFAPEFARRDRALLEHKSYRFIPIFDYQFAAPFANFKLRLQNRFAQEIFQRFGNFSPHLLGYGVSNTLKIAKQIQADLTIVHSEAGLWVGSQLIDAGFRVGVDFEDWFSEDLLLEDRDRRPIAQLKALERRLIRECSYCLTTSDAMAEAMAEAYQAPKPTVIYNSFPWTERQWIDHQIRDRKNLQIPSIHWFSQTIGPGRGLEVLFQALLYLQEPIEIHLRGHYPESSRQWLEPLVPATWRDRVFIHPTVPNAELLSRIAEHDIGLALEIPYCLNKQFTTSNKLFQYLQAGLAVIATDTVGQREIFTQFPAIGRLVPSGDAIALAQTLQELLSHPEQLVLSKSMALDAAKALCWEHQAETLVKAIDYL